jgi:hypothetical protein
MAWLDATCRNIFLSPILWQGMVPKHYHAVFFCRDKEKDDEYVKSIEDNTNAIHCGWALAVVAHSAHELVCNSIAC